MNKRTIATILTGSVLLLACSSKEESTPKENPMAPVVLDVTQVIGQARIEPEGKIANLSTAVNGIVKNVWKNENDVVARGELIVELEHDIEQAKVAQLQSRIRMQAARIKAAEFEMAEVNARLANKEKEFQRLTSLLSKGSETQQRVDDAETELNVLRSSAQRASANVAMYNAELNQIQNERDLAQVELGQRFIKAPSAGRLISMSAVPGSALEMQNPFAEFAPSGKLIARVEVDELFADKVEVGQRADIRLVGKDEVITSGKIIYASSYLKRKSLFSEKAGDQEDRRVREVKVELDNPGSLLINARVECVINTGK